MGALIRDYIEVSSHALSPTIVSQREKTHSRISSDRLFLTQEDNCPGYRTPWVVV